MYIWERQAWPDLKLDHKALNSLLCSTSREQGRLLGKMSGLGFDLQQEASLLAVTDSVVKSSEIEGEKLNRAEVRSCVARRLNLDVAGLVPSGHAVEGVVEMTIDATANYAQPLTSDRLFRWHTSLFPTGRSGMQNILVGKYRDDRDGPMQVVSGPHGKQHVHYEAPPADRLGDEMGAFLSWVETPGDLDPLLVAGIAHLWFVTLRPFEDGNGRIGRAISDLVLARSEQSSQRFYSFSSQIMAEREDYYSQLESAQKGALDVSRWMKWFLSCLLRALGTADHSVGAVVDKALYWERYGRLPMNERQIKILNRMLDGFEGKLTSSKWAKLAKCSQDTAHRDIKNLVEKGALIMGIGGGRSTSYLLAVTTINPPA